MASGRVAAPPWFGLGALVLLVAGSLFAVMIGSEYGVLNHNSYLVHSLHLRDPELFARDWVVSGYSSYHFVFSRLAAGMLDLNESGALFVAANYAGNFVFAVAVFALCGLIATGKTRIVIFLLLIGLASVTRTQDVMHSYIVHRVFQPSTVGGVAFLGALVAFARGWNRTAGALHALCGVFHLNYLVLGFPVFGIAHLLLGRKELPRRLISHFALPCVALVPFVPLLLDAAADPLAEQGRWILQSVRGPHHHHPELADFRAFLGWHVAALAGLSRARGRLEGRRILATLVGLFGLVATATLLTTLVFSPVVSQIFAWRLAPFSTLLAQTIFVASLADWACGRGPAPTRLETVAIALGVALLAGLPTVAFGAAVVAISAAVAARLLLPRIAPGVAPGRRALACALMAWVAASALASTRMAQRDIPPAEQELVAWARTTEISTLFLVPPRLDRFRLHARRAVVVDWKTPPVASAGLVEWYRRMGLVSGRPDFMTQSEVVQGYREMTPERLARVIEEFGPEYAVFEAPAKTADHLDLPEAFRNQAFVVLRLRGALRARRLTSRG
jgi:hypothetical protein